MKFSPLFALSTLVASSVAAVAAPVQAASSLFTETTVNQDSFLVMAAPRANNKYNLVVVEQKPNQRACWQDNGNGTVEPLLLNFDFSGICGRATDSNGYSIRMAGEDLGMRYSLRLVNKGDYVALVGTPSNRRMSELEIGRTQVGGNNFLAVDLNPGWELSRRVYNGKALGHMYFTNATALADTVADTLAQKPVSRPQPAPTAEAPKPQPTQPAPIAGAPLPTPPVAQAPVVEQPVVIEVVPIEESVVEAPITETPEVAQPTVTAGLGSQFIHHDALNAMYQEILGRDVDMQGLSYYNRKLEQGKSVAWVRDRLVSSVEYRRLSEMASGEMERGEHYAALNDLYNEVFGRNVDASGFVTYSKKLSQGKNVEWVRERLVRSNEGRMVAIDRAYQAVLGRHVDPSGLNTYLRRMKRDGWTVTTLQQELANSDEAAANNIAQR